MADSTSLTSRQVDDTYPRTQRAVLTSIALGVMLVPLNSTMIAIALPDVNGGRQFPDSVSCGYHRSLCCTADELENPR